MFEYKALITNDKGFCWLISIKNVTQSSEKRLLEARGLPLQSVRHTTIASVDEWYILWTQITYLGKMSGSRVLLCEYRTLASWKMSDTLS